MEINNAGEHFRLKKKLADNVEMEKAFAAIKERTRVDETKEPYSICVRLLDACDYAEFRDGFINHFRCIYGDGPVDTPDSDMDYRCQRLYAIDENTCLLSELMFKLGSPSSNAELKLTIYKSTKPLKLSVSGPKNEEYRVCVEGENTISLLRTYSGAFFDNATDFPSYDGKLLAEVVNWHFLDLSSFGKTNVEVNSNHK